MRVYVVLLQTNCSCVLNYRSIFYCLLAPLLLLVHSLSEFESKNRVSDPSGPEHFIDFHITCKSVDQMKRIQTPEIKNRNGTNQNV